VASRRTLQEAALLARAGPPFDTAAAPPAQDEGERTAHTQLQRASKRGGSSGSGRRARGGVPMICFERIAYLTPQIFLYSSRYPLSGSKTFFGPPS
jgi:hypothetical protein